MRQVVGASFIFCDSIRSCGAEAKAKTNEWDLFMPLELPRCGHSLDSRGVLCTIRAPTLAEVYNWSLLLSNTYERWALYDWIIIALQAFPVNPSIHSRYFKSIGPDTVTEVHY